MNDKIFENWRKHFLLLTVGLMLPVLSVSSPAHVAVTTIRHGVHADFERVVFDVTRNAQYNIEPLPQSGNLQITIRGTDPQASTPVIQLSPKANLVMGIVMTNPGVFQISTLNPAKTTTFTISGEPFRIVVDFYPKDITISSAVSTPKPNPKSVEKAVENPKPSPSLPKPETPKIETQDTIDQVITNSTTFKDSTFDFNTLYNLKQAALNWQTLGKIDQASDCWEQFLTKAKELKLSITGSDFSFDDNTPKSRNGIHEQILSFVENNLHVILPIGLSIFLLALWIIRRRTKQKFVVEPQEEIETTPEPRKRRVAEKPVEQEDKPTTIEPRKIQKPPEPIEEPPAKEPLPAVEEEALDEFFDSTEEASAQEKKVQRILELAGAEKTIAEIAEEMGIGEDEVRLVLDLQGDRAKSESFQESEIL